MVHRLARWVVFGVGVGSAAGCAPLTSDPEAGPVVLAPQPPPRRWGNTGRVWTTRPNADTCEEFRVKEAPPHSLFGSRAQCEAWVSERRCAPGTCFDGCNTAHCDATGMVGAMTLVECSVQVAATVEFPPTSLEPVLASRPPFAAIVEDLARALEAPARKLIVVGHAGNDEATTNEAREALAGGRAEVVRKLLISAGLPGERIVASSREPYLRDEPLPEHLRVVSFELDPTVPSRAEAEGWRGDLPWCD